MSEPQSQRSWRQLVLPAAATLPFLFSLVFHAVGPREQKVAAGESRPALAFNQYTVDLGKLAPQRYATAWFSFENRSDQAVTIKDIEPSCGCVMPTVFAAGTLQAAMEANKPLSTSQKKHVFQPGESGEFVMQIDTTKSDPGEKEYWVKMHYEDSKPRQAEVTFRADFPSQHVIVRPPSKAYFQSNGKPTKDQVFVYDTREKPLNVTRVECTSKYIQATAGEAKDDGYGNWRIPVELNVAGDVPSGREDARLKIYTDDPDYAELTVPIFLDGPISPLRLAGHEEEAKAEPKTE